MMKFPMYSITPEIDPAYRWGSRRQHALHKTQNKNERTIQSPNCEKWKFNTIIFV